MTEFQRYLKSIGACAEACLWCGERTAEQAWLECERADWLLWWAGRAGIDRKLLVRTACQCARRALRFVPDGESCALRAIEAAEAWCDGQASIDEVRAAAADADAAYDAATAAKKSEHLAMCTVVREMIPFDAIQRELPKENLV